MQVLKRLEQGPARVALLLANLDDDEEGRCRAIPAGSLGTAKYNEHGDHQTHVVFDSGGCLIYGTDEVDDHLSIVESPITDAIVQALGELLKADPVAATRLVEFRTSCGVKVADHPTLVVRVVAPESDDEIGVFDVGMIGVLQAAVASEGRRVTTIYDHASGRLIGFGSTEITVVSPPSGDVC